MTKVSLLIGAVIWGTASYFQSLYGGELENSLIDESTSIFDQEIFTDQFFN